jgi:hypothetical protein
MENIDNVNEYSVFSVCFRGYLPGFVEMIQEIPAYS